MSDHNDSEWDIENYRAENDPGTDNEEEFASISKDGEISSEDDTQSMDTELFMSTQKAEKKKEKCGNKPKFKMKTLTIDGQLVYFCKICDKIFTRRKDKLNHELAHSGETMLTCTECGKEYLHESSLASHMRTHDGDPLFMCDLCPKMFAQSHHLKTHILSHSEPTNFTCKTCYKEFPTAIDLSHHIRFCISQEMAHHWCKMCKVYFCRTHGPECHKRIHAHCCSACNELFYTQKKLKIHMKKFAHFSQDKPDYIEPLTEEELYPHKLLESIKRSQSAKENSILKQSYQNLPGKDNKRCHDDVENTVPSKKFKLSTRKIFPEDELSSTSLQDSVAEGKQATDSEVRSPTKYRKGKPYCKKCNRSFKDSSDLDRHRLTVHNDSSAELLSKQQASVITPFSCKICEATFATKEDLERHGFKHSGERMHVCPMCGEEFPQALQLTRHLKIHMGDHPYRCSQCGKSFRLKIQLIQHVRLHIVQDANSCDKCPAKFNTRAELQDHLQQVHREVLKCHLCGKVFNQRTRLLTHLQHQHCLTEPQRETQFMTQFGLKRSLSLQDAVGLISCSNIKAEPWGSDCESEQSFCSSFTRDSERSDVYKYSSDESYSFKTAMAKERIRLRRKWRRSKRNLLEQQMSHKCLSVKEESQGTEKCLPIEMKNKCDECEDTKEELDFMVELNVVKCEKESVTTIYADVSHKKLVKQEPLFMPEVEEPMWSGVESIHKKERDVYNHISENSAILDCLNAFENSRSILNELNNVKGISCGNMLMFEFDPGELGVNEEDLPVLLHKEHSLTKERKQPFALKLGSDLLHETKCDPSHLPPDGNAAAISSTSHSLSATFTPSACDSISSISAAKTISTCTTISSVSSDAKPQTKRLISDLPNADTSSKTHTIPSLKSDIISITSDTVAESSAPMPSGLARLKEVFQNSSKYLPLSIPSKQIESLNAAVINTPGTDINSTTTSVCQSFDNASCSNTNLWRTENKIMHMAGKAGKCPEGVAKFEPLSAIPFAKDKVSTSKKSQSKKSSRSNLKENCKVFVKTVKSEKTPVFPNNQLSNASSIQACEKFNLPHLNTMPSSSFSLCLSLSSAPNTSVPLSHCVPITSQTVSSPNSSSLLESKTSCITPHYALNPNQKGVVSPFNQSHEAVPVSSTSVIQPSSIFDTNNPVLRDMNMMDLVKSCTPAPALPSPRSVAIPTPLPQPEVQQLLQPHNIHVASVLGNPVGLPVSTNNNPLANTLPPPPTPAQISPSCFTLPQSCNKFVPRHAILATSNEMRPQLLQHSENVSNYNSQISNAQILEMRVQNMSAFTAQSLPVPGLTHMQQPLYQDYGPSLSSSFQQPQGQLISGPPDISTLMNLNSILSGGYVPLPGVQVGNDPSLALSIQMRSLQETALKESLYFSATQSNGFQQNFNGMLVGGLNPNPQFQPNISNLGCFGLNPGAFSDGTGSLTGQFNFSSPSGGSTIGLGGPIPTVPQPQMVNVLNSESSTAFSSNIGLPGLSLFEHHPSAQLNSSSMNPSVIMQTGSSSLSANVFGVLGPQPSSTINFPPHFTGFPHF